MAQANKQLSGAEKLHLELDLPYTQFLVDRATADADYAAEARQLLIGHALNINDAANIRITADQLASSITESANAAAVQGHANTVASSLSSGTQAIAGSLGSSGTTLASAIQSYQQAEAQIQHDYDVAVYTAQRQFVHDGNSTAFASAKALATETRSNALKQITSVYVAEEIQVDGTHRTTMQQASLNHTNNVGQSWIARMVEIAANIKDYQTGLAQSLESFTHKVEESERDLELNLADEYLTAHEEAFEMSTDPWAIRHLALEQATADFSETMWPVIYDLKVAHATGAKQLAVDLALAPYERSVNDIQAEAALDIAHAIATKNHAADWAQSELLHSETIATTVAHRESNADGGQPQAVARWGLLGFFLKRNVDRARSHASPAH